MAAQPVIYATEPYSDTARTIVCPQYLVRGSEPLLLARVLGAIEDGNVDLDMSEVVQIDAAGLGALAVLKQVAQKHGTRIRFVEPAPRVRQLLALTRLDSTFSLVK